MIDVRKDTPDLKNTYKLRAVTETRYHFIAFYPVALFLFVTAGTSTTWSRPAGTPAASGATGSSAASGSARPFAGITAGRSTAAHTTARDALKSFTFLNGCGIATGKILWL
jgi:hypothetical protein